MEALRANRHFERGMMGENRDRFGRLRLDNPDQSLRLCGAEFTLVVTRAERIERDQPNREILDCEIDAIGARREIPAQRKCRAQISPIVPVTGQHIDRCARSREYRRRSRIFVCSSVMNDVAGVDDDVRTGSSALMSAIVDAKSSILRSASGVSSVKWVSEICAMIMIAGLRLSRRGSHNIPSGSSRLQAG